MLTINATGDTTLHTAGKYCEEDILIKVPEVNGENLDAEIAAQNDLIAAQNAKIAELAEVLASKASGGSSNPSIETCTITVTRDESYAILGVRVENGIPVPFYSEDTPDTRTWETVCGSVVVISSPWSVGYDCINATFIGDNLDYTSNGTLFYNNLIKIFRIDAKAGETAAIIVYEA